jgi:hypothetical protein
MCQLSTLLFKDFSLTILSRMGVFIMRNFISNIFRFSTISIAVVGFFAPMGPRASADVVSGLNVVGYEINSNAPPRVDEETPDCSAQYASINNWPDTYMAGCRTDQVMLHYTGYITIPTQAAQFRIWSDDGSWATIGDNSFGYWGARGCSYTESPVYEFSAGQSVPIDAWFYEWGGGECFILWWNIGDGWGPVPESAFTQSAPETTTTTTTTLPPYFNAVENLTAVANEDGSVDLDWDVPTASNVDIYAYGVTFYDLDEIGGTTSGGWGVWTDQGTTYSLSTGMFSGSNPVTTGYGPVRFGIKAGNQSCFSSEGVGPCAYGPEVTVDVTVLDPTPPTTTTTEPEPETTTTTEPEPETTTTTEPEPETTTTTEPEVIPPVVIPPDTEPPVVDTEPEVIEPEVPEPETTEPETIIPEPEVIEPEPEPETTTPEEISDQVDEILSEDLTEEEFANAVDEILTSADNEEELVAAATELLSGDLSEEQFTEVIDQVFAEELSDEAFAEVLDTVFEEPLSDEEFTAVIDAVLDQPLSDEQFENLVDVLSSDTVTDEQVQEAVDAIIENGITEEQATEIATSAEVLSSIDGEQAAEIFAEIPIDDITDEQALEIIAAVQDAPTEVRSSFEEEINIFGSGSLNTYVPLGSSINVGQRRAVIAAGAVIAVAPVAGASRRR